MKSVHSSINECSTRTTQRQRSMASQELGIDTIRYNSSLRLQPHIVSSAELGESPFPALNDLLAAGKLELGTAEGLSSVAFVAFLATNREQHLPNSNPSAGPERLPESSAHTSLKPIGSGARKHLVDSEDMEGVNPNPQVERIFSGELGHVLVAGDSRRLESLAGNVFLLPGDEVNAEGELVDALLRHADIVDSDLGVGHTAAEAGFRVGFVLNLAVASGGSSPHGSSSGWFSKP